MSANDMMSIYISSLLIFKQSSFTMKPAQPQELP